VEISLYELLVGKPEEKGPLKSYRYGWEDNIRMYLRETGWEGVEWIQLAQVGTSSGLL
jgi:hypothetical protein